VTPTPPAQDIESNSSTASADTPRWSNWRDILHYAVRHAGQKNLTQVASSLTFTTVLSLVPLLAVVLALFTAFPLFAQFRLALEGFLTDSLLPPSVAENVMAYLNQFAAKASGLTAIGSLFLIVTSVMMIHTIDQALNNIWQVRRRRPLRQRLLLYWAILSLGPILAGFGLWATATLVRESMGYVQDIPRLLELTLSAVPVLLTSLAFTALFLTVPNRHVAWRDALVGGVGTAIALEIMRAGFTFYLARFPSYTVIYGAFATLPIFLMWMYLSWLTILMGATVAALLPGVRQRHWAAHDGPGMDYLDALKVLEQLWKRRPCHPSGASLGELAETLHRQPDALISLLRQLKNLDYIVNTDRGGTEHWVLSCDPGQTTLSALINELLLAPDTAPWFEGSALAQATADTLIGKEHTLDELFAQSGPPKGGPDT